MQFKLILLLGIFLLCANSAEGQRKVNLDEACELSAQCQQADTFAVCDGSPMRCVCKENFEQHQGKCLWLLDFSCTNHKQCEHFGASICLPQAMKCACNPNYVPNHSMTTCVRGVGLGRYCTSADQCQQQLGAGSTCLDNRCSCRIDHLPNMDNQYCVQPTSAANSLYKKHWLLFLPIYFIYQLVLAGRFSGMHWA